MRNLLLSIMLLFAVPVGTFAQLPSSWSEYYCFRNVSQLETVDDNVFALSENGVFVYNTSSKELSTITKLSGLSSVGLTCMAFCDSTSSFLIGYDDGGLDIVSYPSLSVRKISDIQQKTMYGSKAINAIEFRSDTAYLATDFGVVVFSMKTRSFISSTILSDIGKYVPVKSIAVDGSTVYAATTEGIFYGKCRGTNLSDFSQWGKLSGIPYGNDTINHIALMNGVLYYAHNNKRDSDNDSLYRILNGKAEPFKVQFKNIKRLRARNSLLSVASAYKANLYGENEKLLFSFDSINVNNRFTDVVCDRDGSKWIADEKNGLINPATKKEICPQGPLMNYISDMCQNDEYLHVVCGNIGMWEMVTYSLKTRKGDWYGQTNWRLANSLYVHAVPNSSKYYIGSYSGLIEGTEAWKTDNVFNQHNSPMVGYSFYPERTVVNGIASDNKQTIWCINASADKPLVARTRNDEWYSFSVPREANISKDQTNLYTHIIVDNRGYKWLSGTSLLTVFSENGTLGDTSDDLLVQIKLSDSEGSIADRTTCLAEDLDGNIWIGTTKGIAVHSSPARVFKDRQTISRIKIEIDGEVGYLLSSESISSIAVDGGNRKWIGTDNSGVFLVSENGTEQILNFTKDNSPLPSNKITAIAIDGKTGEVAIGTDKGLVSYWGDATTGKDEMTSVYAMPNPVREDYDGDIYIKGLATDAYVKITDVAGNLVNHMRANGGTAVWNGRDLYGKRAKTGVYLVYASDESGKYTAVSKIVFVN